MNCGAAKFAVLFIVFAAFPATTRAQGTESCNGQGGIAPGHDTQVLCTRLIDFSGLCGKPNIPNMPHYEDVAVYLNPWEEKSITIREVQVSAVLFGPIVDGQPKPTNLNIGIFSGNSYNSDPMTPYEYAYAIGAAVTVVRARDRFPAGTGMQFPGKIAHAGTGPSGVHLDVHLDCGPDGASYFGKWFLAYTVNR